MSARSMYTALRIPNVVLKRSHEMGVSLDCSHGGCVEPEGAARFLVRGWQRKFLLCVRCMDELARVAADVRLVGPLNIEDVAKLSGEPSGPSHRGGGFGG